MHLGCCSTFGERKNTLAYGSCFSRFNSESLATSRVHGSRNPARKTFGIPLLILNSYAYIFLILGTFLDGDTTGRLLKTFDEVYLLNNFIYSGKFYQFKTVLPRITVKIIPGRWKPWPLN
jgi:hypothetical protein